MCPLCLRVGDTCFHIRALVPTFTESKNVPFCSVMFMINSQVTSTLSFSMIGSVVDDASIFCGTIVHSTDTANIEILTNHVIGVQNGKVLITCILVIYLAT